MTEQLFRKRRSEGGHGAATADTLYSLWFSHWRLRLTMAAGKKTFLSLRLRHILQTGGAADCGVGGRAKDGILSKQEAAARVGGLRTELQSSGWARGVCEPMASMHSLSHADP